MKEAMYVEPSPEWCVKEAQDLNHPASRAVLKALSAGSGTVFSKPDKERWDSVSFWRQMTITAEGIDVEFNENWRERFTNPQWVWHNVPRPT